MSSPPSDFISPSIFLLCCVRLADLSLYRLLGSSILTYSTPNWVKAANST